VGGVGLVHKFCGFAMVNNFPKIPQIYELNALPAGIENGINKN